MRNGRGPIVSSRRGGASVLLTAATPVAARPGTGESRLRPDLVAGLILADVVSRTMGIPVIEPRAVEAVGITADVVEAPAVLVALELTPSPTTVG